MYICICIYTNTYVFVYMYILIVDPIVRSCKQINFLAYIRML